MAGMAVLLKTSSLGNVKVTTAPNVSARNGQGGRWLLDPPNIRIVEGNGNTNIGNTNPFEPNDTEDAELGVDLILAALNSGAFVNITTTGDTPGEGNIVVDAALDYNGTGSSFPHINCTRQYHNSAIHF